MFVGNVVVRDIATVCCHDSFIALLYCCVAVSKFQCLSVSHAIAPYIASPDDWQWCSSGVAVSKHLERCIGTPSLGVRL